MFDITTHGVPNWVDLSTPNVEEAVRFYSALFGWDVERSDSPMGTYHLASVGDQQVGGMMAAPPEMAGMPAMWTIFFHVTDIDETVETVETAGGTTLERPFALPDGTRIAVVADPTGAMFAMSDGLAGQGSWYSNRPGCVSWVELLTRDPAAAESFYASVLHHKAVHQVATEVGASDYTICELDGDQVCGLMQMPEQVPAEAPSHWAVYFSAADCDAVVRRAVELGGRVLVPTTDLRFGRFAVLADPDGASFSILEHQGPEPGDAG